MSHCLELRVFLVTGIPDVVACKAVEVVRRGTGEGGLLAAECSPSPV